MNPYTFVPFPEIAVPRGFQRTPAGHARCDPGRLGGRIDVEVQARSPLLLRGVRRGDVRRSDRDGEVSLFPRRTFPDHGSPAGTEPVPFLPGSSLAGVVRSLHELVAGGCLRVFDQDFRPGYRDFAQARDEEEWTLGVVEQVDTRGRPTRLRLCSEVAWAPASGLARVLGGPEKVVTGTRVGISGWERVTFGQGGNGARQRPVARNAVTQAHWIQPDDGWVVLVTDSGARHAGKSFWCAVGKVGTPDRPGDVVAAGVTDEAWEDFQHAVDGTNDIRVARAEDDLFPREPVEADVFYEYATGRQLVGKRHEARPGLHPGQVLWVRKDEDDSREPVDGLALSHIWRHAGAYATGDQDRVPEKLLPCEDPDALCPTCRLFGSADTSGADTEKSRQRAYRGHVRFSDARPVGKVGLQVERLAPLGAPRPGAGQFYLEDNGTAPATNTLPLREWGSRADEQGGKKGKARALRGRKQYWLTGRYQERPLFRVSNRTWSSEMATTSEAAKAGSRFTFSVHFEGLDRAELGGLLAALCPGLLLGNGEAGAGAEAEVEATVIGCAVGGGRPLGFGSCTTKVTALEVDDPASRYARGSGPRVTADEVIEAFRRQVDSGVRHTWPAVTAALTLDQVEPGTVWYPPERPFEPSGPLRARDLQPDKVKLDFWKQSQGLRTRKSVFPLLPLPDVLAEDQSLPVSGRAADVRKQQSNDGQADRRQGAAERPGPKRPETGPGPASGTGNGTGKATGNAPGPRSIPKPGPPRDKGGRR